MTVSKKVLEERIVALLHDVSDEVGHLSHHMATTLGLHPTDLHAIATLHRHGGRLTVSELGGELDLSSAAVTSAVDRLEQAGHVRRVRDQQDRRQVYVEPTAQATAAAHQILDGMLAPLRADLATHSARDLVGATRVLESLLDALHERRSGDSPPVSMR